jgi:uncharacterized membrane protein
MLIGGEAMKPNIALTAILVISIIGILFSGYLSYSELFGGTCPGGCATVGPFPACVYGLVMYLLVFVLSYLGLKG